MFQSDRDATYMTTEANTTSRSWSRRWPARTRRAIRPWRATLKDQKIDRAYVGSCTGGKITDFVAAARILSGRKVAVDTFIVPATVEVDRALDSEKVGAKTSAADLRRRRLPDRSAVVRGVSGRAGRYLRADERAA